MKLEQAIQEITENGYKFVSLYRNGEQITKFNQAGRFDAKLEEIKKRIESFPGSYVIMAKFNNMDKPDQFALDNVNGNAAQSLQENAIIIDNPRTLENKQVLSLSIENEKLKLQNEQLLKDIAELENLVAELEQQNAEMEANNIASATPTLMENAQSFLGTLMEFGAPLLDQHFALQKQKLEIERMKYGGPRPQTKADPEKVAIRKIGEWIETKANEPEIYEMLHNISAQAQTVTEFLQILNNTNSQLYAELQNQL
jgi:cell division septum initiation protein DivIVA